MTEPRHIVAACALVADAQGRVLLVHSPARNVWELPGGQMLASETLPTACCREVEEETGVVVKIGPLMCIHHNLTRGIVIFGFRATAVGGALRKSMESDEVAWVPATTVVSLLGKASMRLRFSDLTEVSTGVQYRSYTTDPFTLISSSQL